MVSGVHMKNIGCAGVVTLRQVWHDYQLSRHLKRLTIRNYEQRLRQHLGDWLDLPIDLITKEMVEERHRNIKGWAMANSTMRTLRALLTYANYKYEDADGKPVLPCNPVRRLSEVRAWHKDRRRKTVLRPRQLPEWFRGVFSLDNSTFRDLLLLLIFTGLRRSEAMNLRWDQVNLDGGLITLYNTKNGDDFVLPLSDYPWRMLKVRALGQTSPYVFPSSRKDGPITASMKGHSQIEELAGLHFCLHDLRRTWATVADEIELKSEVAKALLNHRPRDITESYTIRSPERLRRASQKVTDAILYFAGLSDRFAHPR